MLTSCGAPWTSPDAALAGMSLCNLATHRGFECYKAHNAIKAVPTGASACQVRAEHCCMSCLHTTDRRLKAHCC